MNDKPEAVAWMYTRLGETHVSSEQWVLPEADYIETPLYVHPPSQDASALVEAAQPFLDEIDRLEREYGFDRPPSQGQCMMLPLSDLLKFRAALAAWEAQHG